MKKKKMIITFLIILAILSQMVPAFAAETFYLNVNGVLEGVLTDNSKGYATFDVYINGRLDANDVNDYWKQLPKGTTYKIADVRVFSGKRYEGVENDSLEGTVQRYTEVNLCFSTVYSDAKVSYPNELFLEQATSDSCTLAAATMMLRARSYLLGEDWESITEQAVRPSGWTRNGLLWDFTHAGVRVSHKSVSGLTLESLEDLLAENPAGVVIYCREVPHAVWCYSIDGGAVMVGDSAWGGFSGRGIQLGSSRLKILGNQTSILSKVDFVWLLADSFEPVRNSAYQQKCESYPSCAVVAITSKGGAPIHTEPCSEKTDKASKVIETLSEGTELDTVALIQNTKGNWWYEIEYDGNKGFVWADNTKCSNVRCDTVVATGGSDPSVLNVGDYFDVAYRLESRIPIDEVSGRLMRIDEGGGTTTLYQASVKPNSTAYQLGGETIDRALRFDLLAPGVYQLLITATVTSHVVQDGPACQTITYAPVVCQFEVFDTSERFSTDQTVMTAEEFVKALQKIADRDTVYISKYPQNLGLYQDGKISFDCSGLVKATIWSKGSIAANYTDGNFQRVDSSFGFQDWSTDGILKNGKDRSSDFTDILPGEIMYMPGHVGVYCGDNHVIECTSGFGANGVIVSDIDSQGSRSYKGAKSGKWESHFMMSPWIDYSGTSDAQASEQTGTAGFQTGVWYEIKNLTANYLNVVGSKNGGNGVNIDTYSRDFTSGERFQFTLTEDGWYTLTPKCAPDYRVNVYGTSSKEGSNVNIWKSSGHSTQGFYIEAVEGGYILRSANDPSLVISATGWANSSNVKLSIYEPGNDWQIWEFNE